MDAGRLGKRVDETHAQLFAAFGAQRRTRQAAVVAESRIGPGSARAGGMGAQQTEGVGRGLRPRVRRRPEVSMAAPTPARKHRRVNRRAAASIAGSLGLIDLDAGRLHELVLVSISLRTSVSNCAELSGIGSAPRPRSLSRVAGFCSALAISA